MSSTLFPKSGLTYFAFYAPYNTVHCALYIKGPFIVTASYNPVRNNIMVQKIRYLKNSLRSARKFKDINKLAVLKVITQSSKALVFIREVLGSNPSANHIPSICRLSLVEMWGWSKMARACNLHAPTGSDLFRGLVGKVFWVVLPSHGQS